MVKKTTSQIVLPQPVLIMSHEEALSKIDERIDKGKVIVGIDIASKNDLIEARDKRKIWHEYNEEMLSRMFSNEKISNEYKKNSQTLGFITMGPEPLAKEINDFRSSVQRKVTCLESIKEKLPLYPETETVTKDSESTNNITPLLHPIIYRECAGLVESGYFAEAIEKSFKIVREQLRKLTGYETASEAFGKGSLFIKGAAASNVESDFQEAVKFLGMSIDYFRNEKAHTITANVQDENKAYQYLVLSSISLQHLEKGEIRKK